jgi:hypothetical protein
MRWSERRAAALEWAPEFGWLLALCAAWAASVLALWRYSDGHLVQGVGTLVSLYFGWVASFTAGEPLLIRWMAYLGMGFPGCMLIFTWLLMPPLLVVASLVVTVVRGPADDE